MTEIVLNSLGFVLVTAGLGWMVSLFNNRKRFKKPVGDLDADGCPAVRDLLQADPAAIERDPNFLFESRVGVWVRPHSENQEVVICCVREYPEKRPFAEGRDAHH